jgi:hypothetical protein
VRYDDLNDAVLDELVRKRASFEVVALGGDMDGAIAKVEAGIESRKLSCRVYLHGRTAPAFLTWGSLLFVGAHNLATFNPDYEIAKHKFDNKLRVIYKK